MRNAIEHLLAFAVFTAVLYLLGAFVEFDFNVANWTPLLRFLLGGFALYTGAKALAEA